MSMWVALREAQRNRLKKMKRDLSIERKQSRRAQIENDRKKAPSEG